MESVMLGTIESKIYVIRGFKIMLDRDLSALYGVSTGTLNQAVNRNLRRFPHDFMFQLTPEEAASLVSQFVISNKRRGGNRFLPYAFTEQGVAMVSSVLNSERAIQVNIAIMRVFSRLKDVLGRREDLALKLHELEEKVGTHDINIQAIFRAINPKSSAKPFRPSEAAALFSPLNLKVFSVR